MYERGLVDSVPDAALAIAGRKQVRDIGHQLPRLTTTLDHVWKMATFQICRGIDYVDVFW